MRAFMVNLGGRTNANCDRSLEWDHSTEDRVLSSAKGSWTPMFLGPSPVLAKSLKCLLELGVLVADSS